MIPIKARKYKIIFLILEGVLFSSLLVPAISFLVYFFRPFASILLELSNYFLLIALFLLVVSVLFRYKFNPENEQKLKVEGWLGRWGIFFKLLILLPIVLTSFCLKPAPIPSLLFAIFLGGGLVFSLINNLRSRAPEINQVSRKNMNNKNSSSILQLDEGKQIVQESSINNKYSKRSCSDNNLRQSSLVGGIQEDFQPKVFSEKKRSCSMSQQEKGKRNLLNENEVKKQKISKKSSSKDKHSKKLPSNSNFSQNSPQFSEKNGSQNSYKYNEEEKLKEGEGQKQCVKEIVCMINLVHYPPYRVFQGKYVKENAEFKKKVSSSNLNEAHKETSSMASKKKDANTLFIPEDSSFNLCHESSFLKPFDRSEKKYSGL